MSLIFPLIIILIAIISMAFCSLSAFRLVSYIQAYRFSKDQYRPLFGFLHLRLMMWMYIFMTLLTSGLFIVFLAFINL
ncbi:hypothetical protein HN748_02235 [Candidatus Peregrinibacteria bacterium]|nr:hypothetical protein [Candidatus Peregrinibacteria bacterium]MBT7483783.1 hypothetical protein [Candidatus Peregrinibacteria bacterium]MBT7703027.1 hypothetical protein [Candidatus Peregrinibacteria bacterium]